MCRRPFRTMASVPAQAAEVRELGAVQDGQTRNLGAPIQANEDASAAGTLP
jgi:hypothetical protein